MLTQVYQFPNFREALAFTNQVGELAEARNHHPSLLTEWGKVTVSWWTHKTGKVEALDRECAARTDEIYKSSKG